MKTKEIAFTKVKLPHGWLGNMSPFPIEHMGKTWKTTEALFQALRFNDPLIQEAIRAEASPMGCKMKTKSIVNELAKNGELHKRHVEPLSSQDLENMELCVRLKIQQHPVIGNLLLRTVGHTIYEDVTLRGRKGSNLFWGAIRKEDGSWEGQNHLGKIWMKIREEMIAELSIMPSSKLHSKFGLDEDPYKFLRENMDMMILYKLDMSNMQRYSCEEIDTNFPPHHYTLLDTFAEEMISHEGKKISWDDLAYLFSMYKKEKEAKTLF